MENVRKWFTKQRLAVVIASVVILTLLIVAVKSGAIHNALQCPDCNGTGIDCETCGETGIVNGSLWALLPPFIAIGLALITKEVYSSLFIGIVSGAILASDFNFLGIVDNTVETGFISSVSGNAGIFIFLIELGIVVALINKSGGSVAFGNFAKKHVKTKVGAQLCTFLLGVLIFIDDYFNCLTVGSVMKPVTDKHKVSRSKLAYLIDATAAPICMIAPISSWAAAVSKYAEDGNGLKLFVMAIPFNFYSLLTLVFIITLVLMKFDFGPMKKHEINAENGDLFSGERVSNDVEIENNNASVFDLIVPIVILIISCVFALIYVGGYYGTDWWGDSSNAKNFIGAFGNTDATIALPWGGLVALVISIIYLAIRKVVTVKESTNCISKGFIAMVPAILILTMATALKEMTSVLGAKYYVASLMDSAAAGLQAFLPAIIFIVACILAFATGTSWGTFGILIPIVTAMFEPSDMLLTISMSACLAGAVCGDHCSPISDTTIMSSAGAECVHLNHVTTQIPYAVTVAAISFVMFIIAGLFQLFITSFALNAILCLVIGIALTIATLFVIKKITNKQEVTSKQAIN